MKKSPALSPNSQHVRSVLTPPSQELSPFTRDGTALIAAFPPVWREFVDVTPVSRQTCESIPVQDAAFAMAF
jgi:hypothetical protein